MKLQVSHRAEHATDWHLGHLDGQPAVGDAQGNWYKLRDHAIVHNSGERLVWTVKLDYGVWECIHDMHWQDQYVDPPSKWTQNGPDHVEKI